MLQLPKEFYSLIFLNFPYLSFFAANPFQMFFMPYLEQARQIWPWLVGAAVVGGAITGLMARCITLGCRKKKNISEETQPLLMESEDYQHVIYQSNL